MWSFHTFFFSSKMLARVFKEEFICLNQVSGNMLFCFSEPSFDLCWLRVVDQFQFFYFLSLFCLSSFEFPFLLLKFPPLWGFISSKYSSKCFSFSNTYLSVPGLSFSSLFIEDQSHNHLFGIKRHSDWFFMHLNRPTTILSRWLQQALKGNLRWA